MVNRLLSRSWPLIAFALYIPVFFLPLPPRLESRGIEITDEFLLIILCALIYFAFARHGWLWKVLSLSATLALFTLPLLRIWETAVSGHNFVLGLLPFIDANGYYSDSLRLVAGGLFESQGVYRPLFSAFLATLLKLIDGNLQIAVVVLAIIFALGVFSLAAELRSAFGVEAGVALIIFLQFFYRQFAGTTMTEQLGVPIGAFGLTALVQAIRRQNKWSYLAGLFLISFALMTRSGAYFVLPALMVFGLFHFNEKGKTFLINALLLSLAVAIPWGMDTLVRHLVTPPDAVTSGNFAFTLYGQARGGEGWRKIYIDHPELAGMPLYELGRVAYQYAFEEIKKNPFGLVRGSAKALINFFTPAYLFNIFQTKNQNINLILQILSFVLFLAGLWFVWKKRVDPLYALVLAGFAGIVLSVPFLPPFDGGVWWGGIRVHSATMGFHLIITGIGLSGLARMIPWPVFSTQTQTAYKNVYLFWMLGFVLAFTAVIGSYVVKSTAKAIGSAPLSCAEDEVLVQFPLSPGSFIRVEDDASGLKTYVPVVLLKHVDRSMSDFVYGEFAYIPRRINHRAVFTATIDLITGKQLWIVGPPEMVDLAGKPIAACGRKVEVLKAIELPLTVIYVSDFQYVRK